MTHPQLLALERIERRTWEELARVAPPSLAAGIGLQSAEIGGAFFMMAARIPQRQFNFLSGAGLNGDDGACIGKAVARFREAGQTTFIIQIPPGSEAARMEQLAAEAGLHPIPLAWAKFMRETANPPRVDTSLTVREIGAGERDVFAHTVVAGFGMPAPMAAWITGLVERPGWHAYVSFGGDAPAGAAALYVDGDFAWCGIGATRPQMRRKGSQSALLARRIADAQKYGAKYVVSETAVPQPGEPAPSYKNILGSGFAVAYVRPNWALPG